MKKLLVPALALGFAFAIANSASAGLWDCLCKKDCDPCKPKCESPCKPACKPACPKPCCPKPACKPCCEKPACPKPCDPCGNKLSNWFHGMCHKDRCCNGAAPAAEHSEGHTFIIEPTPGDRLTPVPSNTTTFRSTRRSFDN